MMKIPYHTSFLLWMSKIMTDWSLVRFGGRPFSVYYVLQYILDMILSH